MFGINYRIVDDLDTLRGMSARYFDSEWQHITGFFQVIVGDAWEGSWYHNEALYDGETGPELLEYWFDAFLSVIDILTESSYVAILEIEMGNKWLEFTKDDEKVCVKVAVDSFDDNCPLMVTEPRSTFSYITGKECVVQWPHFCSLIIIKLNSFLRDVEEINPKLLETKIMKELTIKRNYILGLCI